MRTGDAPVDTSTVRGRLATQRAALPCGESRRRPFDALNADKAPDRKVGGLSVPPFYRVRRLCQTADLLALRTPVAPDLAPCARLGAYRSTLGRAAGLSRAPRTPSLALWRPACRLPLRPLPVSHLAPCFALFAARRPLGAKAGLSGAPQRLSLTFRRSERGFGVRRFSNGKPLAACPSRLDPCDLRCSCQSTAVVRLSLYLRRPACRLALRTLPAPHLAPCARLFAAQRPLGRAAGPSGAPEAPSLTLRRPGRDFGPRRSGERRGPRRLSLALAP